MRILIIDDDIQCARSLQKLVTLLKIEVDISDDQMCMVLLQDKKYDLIICDMMMPFMSGDEVYYNAPTHIQDKFVFFSGGVTKKKQSFCEYMRKRDRLFKKDDIAKLVLAVHAKLQCQQKVKIPHSFSTLGAS